MMSKPHGQLRIALAFAGVLALLATVALGSATMRPTEATWQDAVAGEARFGAHELAAHNYARAVTIYGNMQRQITNKDVGQDISLAQPGGPFRSGPASHDDSGVIAVLPLQLNGSTCATIGGDDATECGASAALPNGSGYAASEMNKLGLWAAGLEGIENLGFNTEFVAGEENPSAIRTTATCRPGENGQTSVTADGPVVIRNETNLYLPPKNHQTTAVHEVRWTHDITGVLQNHQDSGPGWAKSEVRLYVKSEAILSDWTLHIVLASAECELASSGLDDLERPTSAAPGPLTNAPNVPTNSASPVRAAFSPPIAQLDEESGDSADGEARENDEGVVVDTTTTATNNSPVTSAPTEPATGTTATSAPETSAGEPGTSVPATPKPAAPGTAESTAPAESTLTPQDVRVGRWFSITGPGGTALGRAKLEDVERTADCGAELTLSITTSDEAGPDRWSSIGPEAFAEVRPGGNTGDAQPVSSDCEQAPDSATTALSPDSDYEIVIAFQLSDSASRAMLRPKGTAGWIFDLPSPATTSAATTRTTTTAAAATTTTAEA